MLQHKGRTVQHACSLGNLIHFYLQVFYTILTCPILCFCHLKLYFLFQQVPHWEPKLLELEDQAKGVHSAMYTEFCTLHTKVTFKLISHTKLAREYSCCFIFSKIKSGNYSLIFTLQFIGCYISQASELLFFVVDNETRSVSSIIEAAYYAGKMITCQSLDIIVSHVYDCKV